MASRSDDHLEQMANQASAGDRSAMEALFDQVYEDLRLMARARMQNERTDHTLQPTALAHEAFLRLVDQRKIDWNNVDQVLALAAIAMRRILVDHARRRGRLRRGGDRDRVELDSGLADRNPPPVDILDLDEALTRLEAVSPRQARVVELRYFTGLSMRRVAEVLEVSKRTADSDWTIARAWLVSHFGED